MSRTFILVKVLSSCGVVSLKLLILVKFQKDICLLQCAVDATAHIFCVCNVTWIAVKKDRQLKGTEKRLTSEHRAGYDNSGVTVVVS